MSTQFKDKQLRSKTTKRVDLKVKIHLANNINVMLEFKIEHEFFLINIQ